MTNRKLLEILQTMDSECLDKTVTVWVSDCDEYYGITKTRIQSDSDVVDPNTLCLVLPSA